MKTLFAATAAVLFAAPLLALPRAEVTSFSQSGPVVTITYTLTDAPAIVTLDIQTNVVGDVWASIGGENIVPGVSADSDVVSGFFFDEPDESSSGILAVAAGLEAPSAGSLPFSPS